MDDYAYIDQAGAVWLWYNRGTIDNHIAMDGLRFADIDGDGVSHARHTIKRRLTLSVSQIDDYVELDHFTGAPIV